MMTPIKKYIFSHIILIKVFFSTEYAFAALNENGSVITWGDNDAEGDLKSVQNDLKI